MLTHYMVLVSTAAAAAALQVRLWRELGNTTADERPTKLWPDIIYKRMAHEIIAQRNMGASGHCVCFVYSFSRVNICVSPRRRRRKSACGDGTIDAFAATSGGGGDVGGRCDT